MEIDGMYENTPWERLALVAPWAGAAALLVAIVLHMLLRARTDDAAAGARRIVAWLGPAGASLTTLGVLFTVLWRPAHDTYPHTFGHAALWTGGGALGIGVVLAAARVLSWRSALLYAVATVAACVAVAISAFSHSIIAEGQVTAMVVPVAFLFALVIAVSAAATCYRNSVWRTAILGIVFLALAISAAWKLPVVQFRDDGAGTEIYPVTGSIYALVAGLLAGIAPRVGAAWWIVPGAILAGAVGYVAQMWFGTAIALLGVVIAYGVAESAPGDAPYF